MNNEEIEITSILDGVEKKTKEVVDTKGYCVYKVKNKQTKTLLGVYWQVIAATSQLYAKVNIVKTM